MNQKIWVGLLMVFLLLNIILINIWTGLIDCEPLMVFEPNDYLFIMILRMMTLPIVCVLILLLIFFIRSKNKVNYLLKLFMPLMLISLLIISIFIYGELTDENKEIENIICQKMSDDGLYCSMENLKLAEYNYLSDGYSILPELPLDAQEIDVKYFREDWFGEFDLLVTIYVKEEAKILVLNEDWKLKPENSPLFKYEYHIFQY